MKLLIVLDEEYVKAIDKIRFLVGGRTDRKLQLEIIKAIKNGIALEQEPTTKNDLAVEKTDMIDKSNFSQEQYKTDLQSAYDCGYAQAKNDLGVDYRSLKDIKKLVERKADALDGVMLDAGGVIIGLYFAIANDLPSLTPQEPINSVLEDIKVEMENLKDNRCFCHHYKRGINECINVLNKHISGKENTDGKC